MPELYWHNKITYYIYAQNNASIIILLCLSLEGDGITLYCRKILKIEGAEYLHVTACEACAKIYDHAHFVSNHAHFCMIAAAIPSFSVNK